MQGLWEKAELPGALLTETGLFKSYEKEEAAAQ